jgi:hypothetical protein
MYPLNAIKSSNSSGIYFPTWYHELFFASAPVWGSPSPYLSSGLSIYITATLSPILKSVWAALPDPHWRAAMEEEYATLMSNSTWDLVPRPRDANVIIGKWIFKHKFKADGTLERYKSRWVLRRFTQRPDINYDETFNTVVKLATVRTVLSLALSRDWLVHQLDVKNAFFHGTLTETLYCTQLTRFFDHVQLDLVCHLNKSLYVLKQAPRVWYNRFASYLLSLGYV